MSSNKPQFRRIYANVSIEVAERIKAIAKERGSLAEDVAGILLDTALDSGDLDAAQIQPSDKTGGRL